MFDTFPKYPRYPQYTRKKSVYNAAYVEQNTRWSSDDFAQECVRIHNHYRAQHGCQPLHLSYSISAVSQEWANRISTEDHFHHSNHPQYGENLFLIYNCNNSLSMVTAQQVVESWYAEHVFYPFHGHISRDVISKAGHFTQMIWSNSREIGIGKAVSKNNRLYIVANYYPAGNILRKFSENVPPKVHNYFHTPHYYSRGISSRRTDMNASTENLHVPEYHRAASRHLDANTEISSGNLRLPHHYARKVSNRLLDTDSSVETLHSPHHYARKVSSRLLDIDTSLDTSHSPHHYARKVSSRQLDTSTETLHVPQFYTRNSSHQIDASDSSVETLHVPHCYTHRNSSKRLGNHGLIENPHTLSYNNNGASSRQPNFDNSTETLHVPQFYARRASVRRPSTKV